MSSSPLLTLSDVWIRYGQAWAVRDVSGTFMAGSLTAVAGPNGAGKSTLLKAIAGILKPNKGRIDIASEIKGKVAYLPQASALDRTFPLSVWQAVATGLWPQIGDTRAITRPMRDAVHAAIDRVGLGEVADRQIAALSGGQFQRLLFARVIVQDARLILLDEPFSAIDAETTARLMQLLLEWHAQGRTVICVLHDLLLIHKFFPESFVLAGKCLGKGHTHRLFEQKLLSFDLDMAEIRTPEDMSLCVNESQLDVLSQPSRCRCPLHEPTEKNGDA